MNGKPSAPINVKLNGEDDIRVERKPDGTEMLIFDPYNSLNKPIEAKEIQSILAKYGVNAPIHNINLFKRAFIHRSYCRAPKSECEKNGVMVADCPEGCMPLSTKSNERLEFVGDGVLECITKYYLYRRFPEENEGFMTEKKIAVVKNESIGRMALEMGLHKWVVLSNSAEQKQTRTNLKKLGCLFEAFLGALFLDFNKIDVQDEHDWFKNVFVCGPGFQMAQIFVESVFEQHIDWVQLIKNDDNYKNILQVIIQKEFKVTPHYLDVTPHTGDNGYHMGVYLCLGQAIHETSIKDAVPVSRFSSGKCGGGLKGIHDYMAVHGKVLVFLGEGKHKIKKKAEQFACESAISKSK
jgi:dsRNA-specific ribonuclease